jgi:hypothetical protein
VKIRTVSGNQVFLLPSDAILKVSAVVACTVQLGASRDYAGYYTIKKTESSANAVTIVPASGEKIDGADSVTLTTENEYKTLAPAEGGWTVVDAYTATPSLASPVLTTPKIADGDKGVTVTSANQTNATPVVTIPNIGGAADEFVMKDTKQTLTKKMLTTPYMENPSIYFTSNLHNYETGVTEWTLSQAESLMPFHRVAAADTNVSAIIGNSTIPYIFMNQTGHTLTVKMASTTGFAIPAGKTAIVMSLITDVFGWLPESSS